MRLVRALLSAPAISAESHHYASVGALVRFALAHKLTTYAMAVSAFFALATSGQLNIVLVAVSLVGILWSWYWEPPRIRYERFARAWTAISVLYFSYSLLSVLAGAEILLSGSSFLTVLLVVKLFNRRELKDYLQIYVLSFLMLVAGTVLNAELTYGLFFLCYVISATWALIIFHLRKELESTLLLRHGEGRPSEQVQMTRIMSSRRIVGGRFFFGTSMVSLAIFLSASLLFLVIPRIGFGLFFDKGRSGVTMAGFHDGVQLGGHGLIKSDDTIVMRIKVDAEYHGRQAPYLHWRGVAFDHYEKGEWRRSRGAPATRRDIQYHDGITVHHLLYDQRHATRDKLRERESKGLRQEIYLEPLGYDVLFGASMPLAFELSSRTRRQTRRETNDEVRHPHDAGIKYVVVSDPTPPPVEELRHAVDRTPPAYSAYLQIPPEIPERVRQLAREITKDATSNYDRAVALQDYLRSNLSYTLEMLSPGNAEPIDFFLFERKRGHCEYFSSAMAIMVRSLGIPARNVNGFLGGEWNEYDDYIAVRAGDAHSWVEVYFPGHGWVTFDPTPSAEIDQLGRGEDGLFDRLGRMLDTLRFKWFQWVIEYDLHRQLRLFRNFGNAVKGGANTIVKEPLQNLKRWLEHNKGTAMLMAMPIILLIAILALRGRRREETARVRGRARTSRHPIANHYLHVLRRFVRAGHLRPASTTPREYARDLQAREIPGSTAFARLTELYNRVEFGPGRPSESGTDALRLAERLRAEALGELKASRRR